MRARSRSRSSASSGLRTLQESASTSIECSTTDIKVGTIRESRQSPVRLAEAHGTAPHGGDNEDVLGELSGVSWRWGAVSNDTNVGVFAGALGGNVFKTFIHCSGR